MALMHLLYFDQIQAFECRHHIYYNEELQ